VQKYENAKLEAEQKMTELEAEFNQPPENINIDNIRKLSIEIRQAMYKVAMLKPLGYEDDYKEWSQDMRQRLESIY
jgi:hypothetical protein